NLRHFRFYPNINLKYRKEQDGRIVCFSPLTGRMSVLNPTMADIYTQLRNHPGLSIDQIAEAIARKFNIEPEKIEGDIQSALIWLFSNGYINIKYKDKTMSFIQLVQEQVGGQ
uniref:PqqD family protein n=1 Tax=Thermococcus sp. TaxID=35749 RepID=UPI00260A3DF5